MSKRLDKEQISNKNTKRLKKERSIGEAKTEIVNQIIEQIKEILEDSIEEGDSTDGFKYTLGEIFCEFMGAIGENKDKKPFTGGLIRIFSILLCSKRSGLSKI